MLKEKERLKKPLELPLHLREPDLLKEDEASKRSTIDSSDSEAPEKLKCECNEKGAHRFWFCAKCDNLKPPRSHHCWICKKCIMWMDHHCPWVGNCVGFNNHKYFVDFLFWAATGNLVESISYILTYYSAMYEIRYSYIVCCILALSLVCSLYSLFLFQIFACFHSLTTIEMENFDSIANPFDLGFYGNLKQLMGSNIYMWLIPVEGTGWGANGVDYPLNDDGKFDDDMEAVNLV